MGVLDIIILGAVAVGFLAAVRHLKKNGSGCGGCKGDCMNCSKKR